MFREMRRKKQQLAQEEALAMLRRATSGVLAVQGDEGYPYAVPISFVYQDGKLYFHSAKNGHKCDAILRSDKASFCVIDTDDVAQSEFTTHYRSAVAFGRVRVLTDDDEIRRALERLAQKYSPDYLADADAEIEHGWERLCVIELAIEHLTGKAAKEVVSAD